MKILVVCHRFPYPPKRGGKIRPFNIIRHFSRKHDVHVASLARSPAEAREAQGLAPYCTRFDLALVREPLQWARMAAMLPTPVPSSIGYFHSTELARRVRATLARERFDLIFVHCSSVARYVEHVEGTPKILDFGDMDSQKWLEYAVHKPFPLSVGYAVEGWKLQREEKRLTRHFDTCTATTRSEWQTLESYGTGVQSDWFPNGVDTDYFAPTGEPYDPDMIGFVGRMDYYPNQQCMFDFCEKTLPIIKARRPRTKLVIIGADPPAAVLRLGMISGVTVTGSVDDVRPLLRRAAVMVAPLTIARGTQNKILEAMALGVPVVTSRVAAGGVDAIDGHHFRVACTPAEYADAVEAIANDPAERDRLATAGRLRMLSHHSWDKSMHRLDGIVDRCLAAFGNRRVLGTAERRQLT